MLYLRSTFSVPKRKTGYSTPKKLLPMREKLCESCLPFGTENEEGQLEKHPLCDLISVLDVAPQSFSHMVLTSLVAFSPSSFQTSLFFSSSGAIFCHIFISQNLQVFGWLRSSHCLPSALYHRCSLHKSHITDLKSQVLQLLNTAE